ncbi:MAG: phosphate signaling complex protein PhoU, partial [Pseudomonadota bacterium]
MSTGHTIKAFDEELVQLRREVTDLGRTVRDELAQALEVLATANRTKASAVIELDGRADELERDVQARVMRILARYQPVANDLREVIAAERLAANLERVGDHAKSIAKRVIRLGDDGWLEDAQPVLRFGGEVRELLAKSLEAFTERDLGLATEAWHGDVDIDESYDDVFHRLIVGMQDGRLAVAVGTQLLFAAKSLERIGDHATNVAEEVRFVLTGQNLDRHLD